MFGVELHQGIRGALVRWNARPRAGDTPGNPTRHRLEIYGLRGDCQAAGVTVKYEGLNCPAIDFSN
jgi:hypothetical protein